MHKFKGMRKTSLKVNDAREGETLEQKVDRIVNNGEPVKDGAAPIYTERKDGVIAAYDIRTDRFEIAVDAADKIEKSYQARREDRLNPKEETKVIDLNNEEGETKGQSTQGTE